MGKIKKEEKLVKQLVQINELSNLFFVSAILCRNTVEILEVEEYNQQLKGFIAFLYIGDSISLNFKFGLLPILDDWENENCSLRPQIEKYAWTFALRAITA